MKDWLKLAETAIRKDHDLRHEAENDSAGVAAYKRQGNTAEQVLS